MFSEKQPDNRLIYFFIFISAVSSISRNALQEYVCSANSVINFKLIRTAKDLDESEGLEYKFSPEFTHQLFGQSENIFGYRNLSINLYYSACKLNRFMSINYTDKVSKELSSGVPPDDISTIIEEKIMGKFTTNIDQFSAQLSEDKEFKPYGMLLDSFKITDRVSRFNLTWAGRFSLQIEINVLFFFCLFHC